MWKKGCERRVGSGAWEILRHPPQSEDRESRYPHRVVAWFPVALNVMYFGRIGHFYFPLNQLANLFTRSPLTFDIVS